MPEIINILSAIAIAILDSVTMSIGDETRGDFNNRYLPQ